MKILSIEPTPSPNSMKLNMDERLPAGTTYNFQAVNAADAPAYVQQLLAVDGVTGVFQVTDFIALERHPKADWKLILPEARRILGTEEEDTKRASESGKETDGTQHAGGQHTDGAQGSERGFGDVQVYLQKFRGIPMQIKLVAGDEEHREGLPQRFMDAAMSAQSSSTNLVMERSWEEHSVRYGDMQEIGEQVAAEVSAAYADERLQSLVEAAFEDRNVETDKEGEEAEQDGQEQEKTSAEVVQDLLQKMDADDWKVRFAALEQMKLTNDVLPVLAKAIEDKHPSVKRLATAFLGEYSGEKALPVLKKALRDRSPVIRRTAGDAISDIGDPQAMDVMVEALKDKNKLVRWRAARFMYEVGDERVVDALQEAQDDPEFEVSLQVKMALERIESGHEAQGTVWQQMTERFSDPTK